MSIFLYLWSPPECRIFYGDLQYFLGSWTPTPWMSQPPYAPYYMRDFNGGWGQPPMAPYAFHLGWAEPRRPVHERLSYPTRGHLNNGVNRPMQDNQKRVLLMTSHALQSPFLRLGQTGRTPLRLSIFWIPQLGLACASFVVISHGALLDCSHISIRISQIINNNLMQGHMGHGHRDHGWRHPPMRHTTWETSMEDGAAPICPIGNNKVVILYFLIS